MTEQLTAGNLAKSIGRLPRNVFFDYPNPKTKTQVKVVDVDLAQTRVSLLRRKDGIEKPISVSADALQRIASTLVPGKPVHLDRVFGSSGNYRAALEALLIHTPEFYVVPTRRITHWHGGRVEERPGLKHLIWLPDDPHPEGQPGIKTSSDFVISEISIDYVNEVVVPPTYAHPGETAEEVRAHIQAQVQLIQVGEMFGFTTFIARNDQGASYHGAPLSEHPSVRSRLEDVPLLANFSSACSKGRLIDAIWFQGNGGMPAVIEVENSTDPRAGLTRMHAFVSSAPQVRPKCIIVGPDERRAVIVSSASAEAFANLDRYFLPYSSLMQMASLAQERGIRLPGTELLDGFIEAIP